MEMGLSQADAARRLNVSRCGVHRLWNQYRTEASVSIRHVPGWPRATTPAGDRVGCAKHCTRAGVGIKSIAVDPWTAKTLWGERLRINR
ncbi:hypothetical protein TNCV_2338161 [Trichonephila clavipes]|nr:hypothetical protein TNCV_2338161 [Trichonephila clavipes]